MHHLERPYPPDLDDPDEDEDEDDEREDDEDDLEDDEDEDGWQVGSAVARQTSRLA